MEAFKYPNPLLLCLGVQTQHVCSKMLAMTLCSIFQLLVEEVFEIKNSFLEKMYELKKEEYNVRYRTVNELLLFHCTSATNVHSIRKDNFDWRKVSRGKFGLGSSFSDSAKYANNLANSAIGKNYNNYLI